MSTWSIRVFCLCVAIFPTIFLLRMDKTPGKWLPYNFPSDLRSVAASHIGLQSGNHCKSDLSPTWNDRMRDILVSVTAKIPPIEGVPVGQIISMLLKAFWPSSGINIWSLIKNQVEGLVDQKIYEFEFQEISNEIISLQKTMQMYVEAQMRERGALMSSMIHASNQLFFKLTNSKNSVNLIPLLVTHSTEHLLILKERLLHGKELYGEDNTKVWRHDLEDQISTYKDSMNMTYAKWVEWRKSKITLDLGVKTFGVPYPPFYAYEPYGKVFDELTQETEEYKHSAYRGPDNKEYFREICELVRKKMLSLRNGELLQILLPTLYLDNFIPGKEDNPSVIPDFMSIASFGPIAPRIGDSSYGIYRLSDDNSEGGEIVRINVREGNILDGFQVIYSTHSGKFAGNNRGGKLHQIQLNNRRIKSLRFCHDKCDTAEVTITFSNGESTGRLGNRRGRDVTCVNTGGIDTYGLYNVRLVGGGCVYGLYQIELDFKPYPTKPSQLDTHNLHSLDLASGRFRYLQLLELTKDFNFAYPWRRSYQPYRRLFVNSQLHT